MRSASRFSRLTSFTQRLAGRRAHAWLAGAVTLVVSCSLVATECAAANALGPSRVSDAVLVRGDRLVPFQGRSIRDMSLFAVRGRELEPIPFQIDERQGDQPGDQPWVYTEGAYARPDSDGGALDANDELAFMARDAGVRTAERPAGARDVLELEVRDPVGGEAAYVYLACFDHDPPRSTETYVRLDSHKDAISTTNYFVSFSTSVPISWSNLTLRGPHGEVEADLLDRLKVRIRALFLLGLVEWKVNEEELKSIPVGYRSGPVRVIRRVANKLETGLGLASSEYLLDTVYYENAVILPAFVEVPFEPGFFMKDISIRISVDFTKHMQGWKFSSSRNPNPVMIDGVMSSEEQTLDRGDTDWVVLSKGSQALFSRSLLLDPRLKNVVRGLYYVDDATAADPPESEPGQTPGVGFEFTHFEGATAGSYKTLGEVYIVNGYERGMEKEFFDLRSKPLTVTAKPVP